jgi:hypothetical protein
VVSSRKFQIPTGAAPVAGRLLAGLLAEFFLLSAGERAIRTFAILVATIADLLLLRATGNLHSPVVVVPVALLGAVGIAGYLYYPNISTSAVSAVIPENPVIYQSAARTEAEPRSLAERPTPPTWAPSCIYLTLHDWCHDADADMALLRATTISTRGTTLFAGTS